VQETKHCKTKRCETKHRGDLWSGGKFTALCEKQLYVGERQTPETSQRDQLEQRRAGSGCFLIRLIPSACSEVPGHGAKIRSKILTPLVAQQAVAQQVLAPQIRAARIGPRRTALVGARHA